MAKPFIDDSELALPRFSTVCNRCANLTSGLERVCKAFPDGIPVEIWTGKNDHTKPFQGDNGVQFVSRI